MISSEIKKSFVNSFVKHINLHFSRQIADEGYLRNELIKIRRLDSLARLFNGSDSQNCTAVCLYKGKLYIASNTDQIEYIKQWIGKIHDYMKVKALPAKTSSKGRDNKDLRKIVACLTGLGRRKINTRTQGGSKTTKFYYSDNYLMAGLINVFNNIILIRNKKGLHAELCVMSYLIRKNLYDLLSSNSVYFGISKLCCKLCACGMNAIGLLARGNYRAIHGNFYNKWLLPEFISNSKSLLRKFLGENAFIIYKANKVIRPLLLELIPTELDIKSGRGASPSCYSDSEAESSK